jgi:hypothetical protein
MMIGTVLILRRLLGDSDAGFAGHHHVHDDQVEVEAFELAPRFGRRRRRRGDAKSLFASDSG